MPTFRGVSFELSKPVQPITLAELEAAEEALRCSFPPDYRDFVLQFGEGEFVGLTLELNSPAWIVKATPEDQARLKEYWFWNESPEVWSQQKAVESITCFDGASGDDIRFHPSDPNTMYILPHDHEYIRRVTGFAELVTCFAEIGLYDLEANGPLVFSPFNRSPAST